MYKTHWLTPEEKFRKKKQRKILLYVSLMLGTILLSALVTFLSNQTL